MTEVVHSFIVGHDAKGTLYVSCQNLFIGGDLIFGLGIGNGKYICYAVPSALHVDEVFLIPDLLR